MGLLSFIFENPDRVLLKLWEHFLLFGVSWIFSVIVGISIAIIATRNPKAKFGTILLGRIRETHRNPVQVITFISWVLSI
ncbi:MAG: hypothetical protein ACLFR1_07910, partial [Spirochaetia bacterium]